MKKKTLLASLDATVTAQTAQAHDKFEMADLTMALKRATAGDGAVVPGVLAQTA